MDQRNQFSAASVDVRIRNKHFSIFVEKGAYNFVSVRAVYFIKKVIKMLVN